MQRHDNKILVILGNVHYDFQRLINKVSELSKELKSEIILQYGHSTPPEDAGGLKLIQFIDKKSYYKILESCDIVIGHCGAGLIIDALSLGKRCIIMPRLATYNEHIDDHQLQLFNTLLEYGYIESLMQIKVKDIDVAQASNVIKINNYLVDEIQAYLTM